MSPGIFDWYTCIFCVFVFSAVHQSCLLYGYTDKLIWIGLRRRLYMLISVLRDSFENLSRKGSERVESSA